MKVEIFQSYEAEWFGIENVAVKSRNYVRRRARSFSNFSTNLNRYQSLNLHSLASSKHLKFKMSEEQQHSELLI